MIRLYERLTQHCTTVNQLNRVHIALENRMVPLGLHALIQSAASGEGVWRDRWSAERQRWIAGLQSIFVRSGIAELQTFRRRCRAPGLVLYADNKPHSADKRLLVCFTGIAGRLMIPLPVFLQHVDAKSTDVILLRYPKPEGYRHGMPGIASGFVDLFKTLPRYFPAGPYRQRAALGVSGGAIPAVLLGMSSQFDMVLAFGIGNPDDDRWSSILKGDIVQMIKGLAPERQRFTRVTLVHGKDDYADRAAVNILAPKLSARTVAIGQKDAVVGHACVRPIVMSGQFKSFLERELWESGESPPMATDGITNPRPAQRGHAQRAQLPALTGPRYFGIGFNKTGTTSLGRCFDELGLGPVAEPRSPYMNFIELSRAILIDENFEPALQVARHFRSFQDRPWNVWDMYRRLDKSFPGSYFILTERDPDKWWNSVERWLTRTHSRDQPKLQRYLRHLRVEKLSKEGFVSAYLAYNNAVKKYFEGSDNLLVIDFEKGHGWTELCRFLKKPIPETPLPHANKQRTIQSA